MPFAVITKAPAQGGKAGGQVLRPSPGASVLTPGRSTRPRAQQDLQQFTARGFGHSNAGPLQGLEVVTAAR